METFLNRLYIIVVAVPVLVWATVYALVTEVPKLVMRVWRSETDSMRDSW